ncbi:MAG: hypothetical protein U0353_30835 [Sandaracinus sp.]
MKPEPGTRDMEPPSPTTRYLLFRENEQARTLFLEEFRERRESGDASAAAFVRLVEADAARRRLPTESDVEETFARLDGELFDGRLRGRTTVKLDSKLGEENGNYGACSKDGKLILLAADQLDWEYHLVHEMVHAFEGLYPGEIQATSAGKALASKNHIASLYTPHSAEFFTKLFEVMQARGHDREWFGLYFG